MMLKKIPLFYLMPIIGILPGLLFGIALSLCCLVLFDPYLVTVLPVEYFLYILLVVYCFALPLFIVKYRQLRHEKKDFRKGNLTERIVVLKESKPLNKSRFDFMGIVLRYFLFLKGASYQKCSFLDIENDNTDLDDYFVYILCHDNLKLFQRLCKGTVSFLDYGTQAESIIFTEETPIKVLYGSKSHLLFKLSAVAGSKYTEDQLSAISQINRQLEYRRKKISPVSYLPICLLITLFVVIFFTLAALLMAYCIYLICSDYPLDHDFRNTFWGAYLGVIGVCYIAVAAMSDKFFSFLWIFSGDEKRMIKKDVYLGSSMATKSFNGFEAYLKWIFPGKSPSYQELRCYPYEHSVLPPNSDPSNTVYFVITKDKYDVIKQLYGRCSIESYYQTDTHEMAGIKTTLKFWDGVPLRIIYTKGDYILREIQPVDDFDYTGAQLAAIEKFNTLYP